MRSPWGGARSLRPARPPQGEFNLTLFEDGLLPAAFMIGLLLSSPVFAEVRALRRP